MRPLALLMALRGLSTRSTLRIFTTEMALELKAATGEHHYYGKLQLSRLALRGGTRKLTVLARFNQRILRFSSESDAVCVQRRAGCYWVSVDSLEEEGHEGHADHQQVQQVEGVPAEGARVQNSSINGHLERQENF